VFDKMKQAAKDAADAAGRAALVATDKAGEAAAIGAEKAGVAIKRQARTSADQAVVTLKDPATHAKARGAAKGAASAAGRGVKSALDKFNPSMLATVVMKATSIQEQANRELRRSRSLYRIGGIEIGAAFPPSISFQIVRAAELELEEEAEEGLLTRRDDGPEEPDPLDIARGDFAG
jgi:hypothetical protein